MIIIGLAHEIDIEQEVIIATLDSVLHQSGEAKDLASKAGITAVHLSYIRKGKRMPSMKTALAIARALPLSSDEQQVWLEHVKQYWKLQHDIKQQGKQIAQDAPNQGILEIRQASVEATFIQDPRIAGRQYVLVANAANTLIDQLKLDVNPLAYIEMCLVLHDSYSVLNRPIDALYTAKRARLVAESLEQSEFPKDAKFLDFLIVNTIRAEAISFHNLALDRQAYELCQLAQSHDALKRNILFWKPHIFRDQLNALAELPRFAISEAEGLANQALEICERRGSEQDELLAFLIHRSLAHAYIQHGNFKKARRILEAKYNELNFTRTLGALHRVTFLRTLARLYWKESKLDRWQQIISEAVAIAIQANLRHQLREMHREFSDQLLSIIESESNAMEEDSSTA